MSVIRGRPGIAAVALRGLFTGMAGLYCVGLEAYLLPYSTGLRKRTRLPCPVICVGNLTTGGTGKTPATQMLCRLLQAQGQRIAVLSRGYGGRNEYGCAIASDETGVLMTPEEAGDEAYLLAGTLPGVPVIVGKDRRATGSLAISRFHPDVIVLDDGLQFWQLHRDLDIVLLNACEPFDNGWTFPRGLLREPPSHLKRAGIVLLTNCDQASRGEVEAVRASVSRYAPHAPVFEASLVATQLRDLSDRVQYDVEWLRDRRVAALSALGNPASFEATLSRIGAIVDPAIRHRDHTVVSLRELETVFAKATSAGAEAVITTEKDRVKLPPVHAAPIPLLSLDVAMRTSDEHDFLEAVGKHLSSLQPERARS